MFGSGGERHLSEVVYCGSRGVRHSCCGEPFTGSVLKAATPCPRWDFERFARWLRRLHPKGSAATLKTHRYAPKPKRPEMRKPRRWVR